MPELVKTEGIVLRKLDFGDTSKIATLITPSFGKISIIIKGGRTAKSKTGAIIDILNNVEVVYYNKKSREVQMLSQADLINNFTGIKENIEKLKYASAVIELIILMTVEEYNYERLYRGLKKILEMMSQGSRNPKLLFIQFFIFLLEEMGYEFQFDNCTFCGREFRLGDTAKFNYELGMMCENCSKERLFSFEFSQELFISLLCLSRKDFQQKDNFEELDKLIYFLERYLMYHISEFKGLKSLHIF